MHLYVGIARGPLWLLIQIMPLSMSCSRGIVQVSGWVSTIRLICAEELEVTRLWCGRMREYDISRRGAWVGLWAPLILAVSLPDCEPNWFGPQGFIWEVASDCGFVFTAGQERE